MYSGGYAGKVLRINLCNRTSREKQLLEEMARDFIYRGDRLKGEVQDSPYRAGQGFAALFERG